MGKPNSGMSDISSEIHPAGIPLRRPTRLSLISRRTFTATVTSGLLAAPLVARAQHSGKIYRVGLVAAAPPVPEIAGPEPAAPTIRAFQQGLRALGYVEGQNLILERRSAEGKVERRSSTTFWRRTRDGARTRGAAM